MASTAWVSVPFEPEFISEGGAAVARSAAPKSQLAFPLEIEMLTQPAVVRNLK
jgi:hypothetical protein